MQWIQIEGEEGEVILIQGVETGGEGPKDEIQRVSRDSDHAEKTTKSTMGAAKKAIQSIRPIITSVRETLDDINTPDELEMEFSLGMSAASGVVVATLADIKAESSFKVRMLWKNEK